MNNLFDEELNDNATNQENATPQDLVEELKDSEQAELIQMASIKDEEPSVAQEPILKPAIIEQEQSENIPFDPERPFSFVDSAAKQQELVNKMAQKLEKIDESTLNNETRGIFIDFQQELKRLTQETQILINFFSTDIPQEDKELINRTTLIKNQLVELYDILKILQEAGYDKQINEVNKKLRNFMLDTQNRIKNYDDNLRSALSERLKHLNTILKEFNARELENMQGFSKESRGLIAAINKDFETTSKKLKVFVTGLLCALVGIGVCFGVLSGFTYLKYEEYKEIENKMASLSRRIDGIVLKKDKKNNLILNISKDNASLQENTRSYEITIKDSLNER